MMVEIVRDAACTHVHAGQVAKLAIILMAAGQPLSNIGCPACERVTCVVRVLMTEEEEKEAGQ